MNKKMLVALSLLGAILPGVCSSAATPPSFTHSRVDMTSEHLTLEIEILPHLLQQARVLYDLDHNGEMNQAEFDQANPEILAYVKKHIGVMLNARELRADSVAVRYHFQEAASAPTRIYVTCWYALLLKPEHLLLHNVMFREFADTHINYGEITYGAQTIDFEFRNEPANSADLEFVLNSGRLTLLDHSTPLFSPALLWLGAGAGGLIMLGSIAYIRKFARRHARRKKRKQRTAATSVASAARRHTYELENALS